MDDRYYLGEYGGEISEDVDGQTKTYDECEVADLLNGKDKRIATLEADLAALREQTRWRKLDEEKPGEGKHIVMIQIPEMRGLELDTDEFYDDKWECLDEEVRYHMPAPPLPEGPEGE